ncbi:5-oxoprolinase subunit PxpB [Paenibacillus sp. R14(2021)]|uniref:5-oxoprolinase subunit PxpB n=1 Tax=Paenibacillus sp. R14(2021) TaxID=2859228 RepID=UPI001C613B7B|nr:5-oxoprolinase subunit PxpB [Paenibacillus sp. R14(2021)]
MKHGDECLISPLGDRALVVEWTKKSGSADWRLAAKLAARLHRAQAPWLSDAVPAYASVTVVYDPLLLHRMNESKLLLSADKEGMKQLPYDYAASAVRRILSCRAEDEAAAPRRIEIPVCYGGEYGPDLGHCADRSGLADEAFIRQHAAGVYQVAMIGFMPGFPYLTGLSERLAQPRRESPRSNVPAGAVGIGGSQTGIYPLSSPGGWQLIGRTPLQLFDPHREEPILLRTGDELRFVPITEEQMRTWGEQV